MELAPSTWDESSLPAHEREAVGVDGLSVLIIVIMWCGAAPRRRRGAGPSVRETEFLGRRSPSPRPQSDTAREPSSVRSSILRRWRACLQPTRRLGTTLHEVRLRTRRSGGVSRRSGERGRAGRLPRARGGLGSRATSSSSTRYRRRRSRLLEVFLHPKFPHVYQVVKRGEFADIVREFDQRLGLGE